MTYTKPEVAVLDNAVRAVMGQVKDIVTTTDFQPAPSGSTGKNLQPAYEADE